VTRPLWWAGAVALGLLAEWASGGFRDLARGLPDLATGWALLACGVWAWTRAPDNRTGPLLALTGAAWFAGNFVGALVALHRGPLVHALLGAPEGRLRSSAGRAALAAAYGAAVIPVLWASEPVAVALSVALLLVAVRVHRSVVGVARRAAAVSLAACAAVTIVIGAGALARLAFPAGAADNPTLLLYELVLCVVAASLAATAVTRPWEQRALTDLVVELGEGRSGSLRDALADALGDPTVEIGYWVAEARAYVDADRRRLTLPTADESRSATFIERDGLPLAALVHDPAVLDDPRLVDAVAAATRMAASNARLCGTVQAQLAELRASRRRLVSAGDEERRRLEQRLHEGAQRRLAELGETLRDAAARAGPGAAARILRAGDLLTRTREDLDALGRGLHPRTLTERGLQGALASLVEASPVSVELSVAGARPPAEVEAVVYFVCAEALANVAKHAGAGRVAIIVENGDGHVRVGVADDGAGGADLARGSGLRGLSDRLEAFGGRLRIDSRPGCGTRLAAEIPLGREAR
jgi:signal transduction histidine kinase